jgi:hypothetical protein
MSVEAHWYGSYVDGEPPKMRRLCRLPLEDQWRAAIDIAISFTRGEAGYRKASIGTTGEVYWYWPAKGYALRSVTSVESDWWLIPFRVERRAMTLCERATETAIRVGRGRCSSDEVLRVLERWRRSGHWQKLIVDVAGAKHEPAVLGKKEQRRNERIADLHSRALERRYSVVVADLEGVRIRAAKWTEAVVLAVWEQYDYYDHDCELTQHIREELIAAGALIEETDACLT